MLLKLSALGFRGKWESPFSKERARIKKAIAQGQAGDKTGQVLQK